MTVSVNHDTKTQMPDPTSYGEWVAEGVREFFVDRDDALWSAIKAAVQAVSHKDDCYERHDTAKMEIEEIPFALTGRYIRGGISATCANCGRSATEDIFPTQ